MKTIEQLLQSIKKNNNIIDGRICRLGKGCANCAIKKIKNTLPKYYECGTDAELPEILIRELRKQKLEKLLSQ